MKLTLTPTTPIADVQAEFASYFPYLKIDFYAVPHEAGGSVWSKYQIFDRHKTLAEVSNVTQAVTFEFSPQTTTGEFEQGLQDFFDIKVQVFRRSMGTWLATSLTDTWTLEQQNSRADESVHTLTEMVYEPQIRD